jgi:drug/metabolite transporter (DMT)-like permease
MTQAPPPGRGLARSLLPIAVLGLVWGANWPILKLGVAEIEPLTFRAITLPFAGLGLLLVARLGGHEIRIPRALWPTVALLAILNITGWNGLALFGVRQLPAGRSSILAYTMPVWATLVAWFALDEPLSARKIAGLALGFAGMIVLLGDDLRAFQRSPFGALMILGAAIVWACGTVMLRRKKPPIPQTALTGWMMIVGWLPLALLAPALDPTWKSALANVSATAWFAIVYNIFLAGTVAHWAWFTLARTLPVAVSSLSSLPVPVVGVFAGMIVLGERPGAAEWIALALVVAALVAVLLPSGKKPSLARPAAPDD